MDRAVLHNPVIVALLAVLLRCLVELHPHSGQGRPPSYGAFEEQRMRMERAVYHSVGQLYTPLNNQTSSPVSSTYPMPPLHAVLLKGIGSLAVHLVPGLVMSGASIGYESEDARAFMRASVLLLDVALFFTATWYFSKYFYRSDVQSQLEHPKSAARFVLYRHHAALPSVPRQRRHRSPQNCTSKAPLMTAPVALVSEVFLIILLQPSFILVGHGHFSFDAVSLGLVLWALVYTLNERPLHAAIAYCLAANFDPVVLYFAPVFVIHLLNQVSSKTKSFAGATLRVLQLVSVWVVCIFLVWLPACNWDLSSSNCLHGISGVMSRLELWPGILFTLPSCLDLLRRWKEPVSVKRLIWAMFNASLGFSICAIDSFETALLMPLLPVAILVGQVPGPSCWFSMTTTFVLAPMLENDKLALPTVVSLFVFLAINASCFRGELCYLPLPWVKRARRSSGGSKEDIAASSFSGIRHGIRMVDLSVFIRVTLAFMLVLGICALSLPFLVPIWRRLHQVATYFLLGLAWIYGNWSQWMSAADEALSYEFYTEELGRSKVKSS